MNAKKLDQEIREICRNAISEGVSPGFAVAAAFGKEKYVWCEGKLDYTPQGMPVTTSTLYDNASLTKFIASLAILKLIERKDLAFQTPLNEFFWFQDRLQDKLTIEDILACRAYFVLTDELRDYRGWKKAGKSGKEWREDFFASATLRIGSHLNSEYSNIPAFLLGLVIEKVMGLPLKFALDELVLHPLSMLDTIFHPERELKPEDIATYVAKTSDGMRAGIPYDPMTQVFERDIAVSGSFSPVEDMLRLARVIANISSSGESFLKPEIYRKMMADQVERKNSSGFGLGLFKFSPTYLPAHPEFCRNGGVMMASTGSMIAGGEGIAIAIHANATFQKKVTPNRDGHPPWFFMRQKTNNAILNAAKG
jgi:CubicO group peptidase (beta-lactamase class C family)